MWTLITSLMEFAASRITCLNHARLTLSVIPSMLCEHIATHCDSHGNYAAHCQPMVVTICLRGHGAVDFWYMAPFVGSFVEKRASNFQLTLKSYLNFLSQAEQQCLADMFARAWTNNRKHFLIMFRKFGRAPSSIHYTAILWTTLELLHDLQLQS